MFYVYRFNNWRGKALYVGRTTNLKNRINQHYSASDKKDILKKTWKIKYKIYKTKTNMIEAERYYIKKLKPVGNVSLKTECKLSLWLICFKRWRKYNG